jgi:alkaline phosphatase D
MPRIYSISFIIILTLSFIHAYYLPENDIERLEVLKKNNHNITNFAFGSCFNGFLRTRMDIFKTINNQNPDLFIFNGDVTYLDELDLNLIFNIPPVFNETESKIRYDDSFNNEYYSILRKNKPVIGMWDDHDYCHNNGDINFKYKNITKNMFLDFLEYPINHEKRKTKEGIQASYSFGEGFKTFKIIMPDLRYYLNGTEMLGESQWQWLENELKSDETFTFIISGVQFLPANRPFMLECWSLEGRKRLMDLLGKLKKSGVIILSGDVHFGEALRTPCIHPSKLFILNNIY